MARPRSNNNLATIAQELSLSISTVSRALRDAEGIHPDTRKRVMQTAQAIGYTAPGRQAALRARPQNVMALAQCNTPSSDQRYLAGMSRAAVPLNLAILSHHVTFEEAESVLDPKFQPAAMRAGFVEGLVLIHRWPLDVATRLGEKWPTVSIVHHYPEAHIDHIGIDDRMGVGALLRRFRETGHQEIGFFGFCREMSWARSRFAAYVEALATSGMNYQPSDVIEIPLEAALAHTFFPARSWGPQVMGRIRKGVKAWVCASSGTAETLCRFLLESDMKIPGEVEVAGYHQRVTRRSDLPALTSTMVADEELGAAALRRLVHRLEHPGESQRSILLPAEFVQGETTLAPTVSPR